MRHDDFEDELLALARAMLPLVERIARRNSDAAPEVTADGTPRICDCDADSIIEWMSFVDANELEPAPIELTDEIVYGALKDLAEHEPTRDSFRASELVRLITPLPLHSEKVRVGIVLRRLARLGRVEKLASPRPDRHRPNRWRLAHGTP